MKKIWTIAWRDFRAYFTSPIAYIVIAAFMFILGWMFFYSLEYFLERVMQTSTFNLGKPPSLNDFVLRPIFQNMNVILLFMMPFITMRLFAEEKKNHTIELLMTSPITLTELVLGKYLSGMLLVSVMFLCTSVFPLVLLINGNPDGGVIFSCYLGTYLLTSCLLALGIVFSALTENQIVAASLTFGAGLFFWLINWATQSAGPVWGDVLTYLSLITHLSNFTVGVITSADVFYYLSFTGVCLLVCHRILDSYRWR